jgi:hypothetical protein
MARLIDADALKEDLTRFYDNEVTARELIDEQPTVGGWISVKDRLPRTGKVYLITLNPRDTMPQTMEAYFRHDGTWWRGSVSLMSEYVTHWMPLPTPPGGES